MADMTPTPTVEPTDSPVSLESPDSPAPNPAPIQMTPLAVFLLMVVIFILGLGSGYLIWVRPLETRALAAEQKLAAAEKAIAASAAEAEQAQIAQENANAAAVEVPQDVKRYDVPADDDHILGNKDAKITIIEFSDYECPFCVRWKEEVLPQIQAKYGDQVRLIYRDFPLYGTHANAESAAEAANCAGAQGQYYAYHDLLFSGQKQLGQQTYETYASQLNLDLVDFKLCLTEHRYLDEVKADYNYASELGVRSTPTFFINGLAVVGAQPFEVFQQVIDLELAGKIP